jgi:hypothetical protein
MPSTYQYEELPAGKWMRLLRLLPGRSDDEIHLELSQPNLRMRLLTNQYLIVEEIRTIKRKLSALSRLRTSRKAFTVDWNAFDIPRKLGYYGLMLYVSIS